MKKKKKNAKYYDYTHFFICHFHIAHNTLCLPPKILHSDCFQFLLGHTVVQGNLKQCLCKIFFLGGGGGGGQTKCIMDNVEMENSLPAMQAPY